MIPPVFATAPRRDGIRTHNALKTLHLEDLFGSKVGRWTPGTEIEKLPSRFAAAEAWGGHNKLGQAMAYRAMEHCMTLDSRNRWFTASRPSNDNSLLFH